MASYDEIMTAIVKKQILIIGQKVAINQAKKVPGLIVDDSGNVSNGDKVKLETLIEKYKEIAGSVFLIFAKKAIQPLLSGEEDLPAEIKQRA